MGMHTLLSTIGSGLEAPYCCGAARSKCLAQLRASRRRSSVTKASCSGAQAASLYFNSFQTRTASVLLNIGCPALSHGEWRVWVFFEHSTRQRRAPPSILAGEPHPGQLWVSAVFVATARFPSI